MRALVIMAALLPWVGGCAGSSGPSVVESRLDLRLAPLTSGGGDLVPIVSATYDLAILYDDDGTWRPLVHEPAVDSSAPGGAMTYIAPCLTWPDESDRPNRVQITVTGVFGPDGEAIHDAILPPPQSAEFTCRSQADTLVQMAFTVMRQLDTGFADITVDLAEASCAAKLDCVQALLSDSSGVAGPTLVTAVSCQSGDEVTTLTYSDVLVCFDEDGVPVDPGLAVHVERGYELDGRRAYHTTARRFGPGLGIVRCELTASALPTARADGPRFSHPSPVIDWTIDVDVDPATGAIACDGRVESTYVDARADQAPEVVAEDEPPWYRTLMVRNAPRWLPGCDVVASDAAASLVEMRANQTHIAALDGDLEAFAREQALLEIAAAHAVAATTSLAEARSLAEEAAGAAEVHLALRAALTELGAIGAVASTGEATSAVQQLLDDAYAARFDADQYARAATACGAVGEAIAAASAINEASAASARAELAAAEASTANLTAAHADDVDALASCRSHQVEGAGVRLVDLRSRFPIGETAVVDRWLEVQDDDGGVMQVEVTAVCAFGRARWIERVVLEVEVTEPLGTTSRHGYVHLVREPPDDGFACEGDEHGCTVFSGSTLPCGFDNRVPRSDDGYVLGDGVGSELGPP